CGHELADGVVQTGLQLVVREDVIEVRYQIGLSPNTAREVLNQWNQPLLAEAPVFPVFRAAALEHVSEQLTATVDGRTVSLRQSSVKEVRRHHARVECRYEFDNPASADLRSTTPRLIRIVDRNFPAYNGTAEVAAKTMLQTDGRVSLWCEAPSVLGRSTETATADDGANAKRTPVELLAWVGPSDSQPPTRRQLALARASNLEGESAASAPTDSTSPPAWWWLAPAALVTLLGCVIRLASPNPTSDTKNPQGD
ncbi:MAG: hypothetical protein KDB14_14210, partial [Planctomycetales bacterium]|nr:hypothetical protein [Planctomycetales bacterium]